MNESTQVHLRALKSDDEAALHEFGSAMPTRTATSGSDAAALTGHLPRG
jgi:hypothetical protein